MNRRVIIASTGSYAPAQEVPNTYFNDLLGEDVDTWLQTNLNIKNRRWCSAEESVADLCERAALTALERAGVKPEALDLIIVATDTPEYVSPSTSSILQHRLGATGAGTFDLNSACAGFVTALDVAAKYIVADARYNHVLVIGGYAMSKYLDVHDKKTATLFADGAGAVLLTATENTDRGFLTSSLHTEGQYHSWMGIYAGATAQPLSAEVLAANGHKLKFLHKFPKELNPEIWTQMAEEMAATIGVAPTDVDHYVLTQLNINGIYETLGRLGVPHDRAPIIMQEYGYTGSACIPMALDDAVTKGQIKENDLVFLIGSGGGLAFAGAAFRM
ncbi:3-oxoacyl-ACP synthase III family protein [Solirubrum puertoriconensis]|uniref:3-ketoacyl-ACP synthase n=1 Tax=Solirubrum puertoriconensis TaxID=1751427 RepID=A0A9X0L500_SOLP1|nr:ketoacyl-ACP synthase III [Solirubrum puertoriconensis]KUG08209.1 3-ketoacyl-ACP synthase [Solirubrum puertoriconensis]